MTGFDDQDGRGQDGRGRAQLRLLWTSDLHFKLLPYDYETDRETEGHGLALAAAEARRAREEVANSLWLDGGDVFEGGPLDAEIAAGEIEHPMPGALAAAGIAAGTLGNHDFDQGLPALEALIEKSTIPLTLCNIVRALGTRPEDDTHFLPPYLILDETLSCADGRAAQLRLGLVGVAPPQTMGWNAGRLEGRMCSR